MLSDKDWCHKVDKRLRDIRETLASVTSACRKAYLVFTVIFVAYCIIAICFFTLFIISASQPQAVTALVSSAGILSIASMLLSLSITGISLFVIRSIFKDIAAGESPFNLIHARQIKAVAWLFVADIAIGTVFSPEFASVVSAGGFFDVGYVSGGGYDPSVIPVDVRGVAGAVVCFSLSLIWRYGSLLQREEDELM